MHPLFHYQGIWEVCLCIMVSAQNLFHLFWGALCKMELHFWWGNTYLEERVDLSFLGLVQYELNDENYP